MNWRNIGSVAVLLLITAMAGAEEEASGFMWAWDVPAPDAEKYPITEHYFWDPPQDFINGGLGYSHYHRTNGEDANAIYYILIARPFVFRIGDTSTLACGLSGSVQHEFSEGDTLSMPDPVRLDWDNQTHMYSVALSFFFSSPDTGIQAYLDIGHYWGRFFMKTDQLATDLVIFDVLSEFRWRQAESGITGFFQIGFLADRLYLYGMHMVLTWSVPTGPRDVKLAEKDFINLPAPLPDVVQVQELETDPIESSFISSFFYLRAFAIDVFPHQRITFEPAIGFSHYRLNRGHSFLWGMRLNAFDIMGLSFIMDHEVNNDVADRFIFTLEVGFRFGRHVNSNANRGSQIGSANRLF